MSNVSKPKKSIVKRIWFVALGLSIVSVIVMATLNPNPSGAVDLEDGFKLAFKPGQKSIQGRYLIDRSSLEYREPGETSWVPLEHAVTNDRDWGEEITTGGVLEESSIRVKIGVQAAPELAQQLGGKELEFRFVASGVCPAIVPGTDDTYDEVPFRVEAGEQHVVRLPIGHPAYKAPALENVVSQIGGFALLITIVLGAFLVIRWLVRRGRNKSAGVLAGAAGIIGRGVACAVIDSLELPSSDS